MALSHRKTICRWPSSIERLSTDGSDNLVVRMNHMALLYRLACYTGRPSAEGADGFGKPPLHIRTQPDHPVSCYGKPVKRTKEIKG